MRCRYSVRCKPVKGKCVSLLQAEDFEKGKETNSVHPEDGDVKDPNSVEVDEKMEERSTFVVSLEERFVPFNLVELHESLSGGNIDETSLSSSRKKSLVSNSSRCSRAKSDLLCRSTQCERYLQGTKTIG